jgi:hypothetical protein
MLISVEDYPVLIQHCWRPQINVERGNVYACRTTTREGAQVKLYAHREITGAAKGLIVDHANRITLDCRRPNLRVCTLSQNGHNRDKLTGAVRFIGVDKQGSKYRARIAFEGMRLYLGIFPEAEMAARAYDAKALELLGPYAWVNFPIERAAALAMEAPPL